MYRLGLKKMLSAPLDRLNRRRKTGDHAAPAFCSQRLDDSGLRLPPVEQGVFKGADAILGQD